MIGIGYVHEVIDSLSKMRKVFDGDGKSQISSKISLIIEAFSTNNIWNLPENAVDYYIQSKAENISVGTIESTPMVVEFCADGDVITKPTVIAVIGCTDNSADIIANAFDINGEWKYMLISAEKDGEDWTINTNALLIGGNNKDVLEMFGDCENNEFWSGTFQAYSEALTSSGDKLNYCNNTISVLIEGEMSIPTNITINIGDNSHIHKIPSLFTKAPTLRKEYINAERVKLRTGQGPSSSIRGNKR